MYSNTYVLLLIISILRLTIIIMIIIIRPALIIIRRVPSAEVAFKEYMMWARINIDENN